MTDVQDKTHELFTRAALGDDDLGYPDHVSFLPGDQEWADEAVRGSTPVLVQWRAHDRPPSRCAA